MKYLFTCLLLILSVTSLQAQCWRKIASKYDHVLAIHQDGTLWRWGNFRYIDEPALFSTDTNWRDISTGNGFCAAIKSDGTLWVWGSNDFGQLGNGTTTYSWVPIQVGTDSNWKQVSCGEGHIAAIRTDGTFWSWGRNQYGQMGNGTNRTHRTTPVQMGTATNWVEVAAGEYATLTKTTLNTIWQVGACFSTENSVLHQVGTATDWKTMSAGASSYYGIKLNGTLWRWTTSAGNTSGMTQIGTATGWNKVDASHMGHILLIKTNGTLWAQGTNSFGCLGTGTLASATLPVQVGTDNDWKEAVAGNMYSLALKNNLTFWGWGRNNHSQFGNGENENTLHPVDGGGSWRSVSGSKGASYNTHVLGIRENGSLWAWGPNSDGQLGDSTQVSKAVPVQVGTDTTWKCVSNGFHFSVGVKEDGSLWTWGRNGRGQLGLNLPTLFRKIAPTHVGTDTTWKMVAAGTEHILAIKENGTLWSWGWNYNGELGIGSTGSETATYAPVQVGTDTTWRFIAAGSQHSMAIKADSTLWTWGDNDSGELGRSGNRSIPMQVGTAKWITVAGAGQHSAGIRSDSTLFMWGSNLYEQTGSPGSLAGPVAGSTGSKWIGVACGYNHSIAMRADKTLWGIGRTSMGQLADSAAYVDNYFTSTLVSMGEEGSTWKLVAGGTYSTHAIAMDGTLYNCGDSYSEEYNMNFPVLGYVFPSPIQLNSCSYCPPSYATLNQSICQGDSVLFNGAYRLTAGIYKDTLVNVIGCDSIITLNLQLLYPALATDTHLACDTYTWIDGETYTASNNTATHTFSGAAANGCDSIVTLNLTIRYSATGTDVQTACDSYTWINGMTYTQNNTTATHTISGGAANGCDSTVTLDLTMRYTATGTATISTCEPYTWIDGNTYSVSNTTATFLFPGGAANGCDSIVTLNLTVNSPSSGTDMQIACGPFTWIDGNTYSVSNTTATFLFPGGAANGCDSIVTLNLVVNNSTSGTDVQTACGPFTWIDGNTYTTSNNTATYTVMNATGCDSTVTLNLTVNSPSTGTDVQTACGSFTWINGITYTESNSTATATLVNAVGCDSIVTLNLTVIDAATGTDVQTSCGPFTWIDGNTYTTSNSTATHTIPGGAANGCDSTVTLALTVTTIDPAVSVNEPTLTAVQAGVLYQWIDCSNGDSPIPGATAQSFTAQANGDYAVILQNGVCQDTSTCETISSIGLNEHPAQPFGLYPNPNAGLFAVELSKASQVVITDALGRKVWSGEVPAGKTKLDLSDEANGVYLVKVKEAKTTRVYRMVINR